MAYESKIRTFNPDRITKNTSVSQSLLQEIKMLASKLDKPYNALIEAGIDYVLQTYKNDRDFIQPEKPTDRKQMATTFSLEKYTTLQNRARKLKTTTNTLLEIGMKYILELNKDK